VGRTAGELKHSSTVALEGSFNPSKEVLSILKNDEKRLMETYLRRFAAQNKK
jgi:hypothetical protein